MIIVCTVTISHLLKSIPIQSHHLHQTIIIISSSSNTFTSKQWQLTDENAPEVDVGAIKSDGWVMRLTNK